MHKKISVVLPATDETYSLSETVTRIAALLPTRTFEFLIVTHPRYSTAACRETIRTLVRKRTDVISFDQVRPGLGGAIQDAFDRATGEITVLMASDLETDPSVLPALLQRIDEGYDIAVASRWRGGARFRGYNPIKLILNYFFQLFFRILYATKLTDLTYAYRAYRTEVIRSIRWSETKFPFLFESLIKPMRLQYKIAEVKAPWNVRKEGVSHNSLAQTIDYFRVGLAVRFLPLSKILKQR